MDFSTWIIFVLFAFITTVSPGPAVLLAISNSVSFGVHKAFYSSMGNSIGTFIVSCGVFIGLGAILRNSATLFSFIKVVGGVYLIYLGIKHMASKQSDLFEISDISVRVPKNYQLFIQGILVAITNPKAILFFISLFPQFMSKNNHLAQQFILLSITFSVTALASHSLYLFFLMHIRNYFSNVKRIKIFNITIGSILVLFGISILRLRRVQN